MEHRKVENDPGKPINKTKGKTTKISILKNRNEIKKERIIEEINWGAHGEKPGAEISVAPIVLS